METALLDLPISFFEYDRQRQVFGNVPTQKTTLRRMVKTKYYREKIEAIRNEPNKGKQDELKKHLPAFTPAALLNHRKKDTTFDEKVIYQYPLMMGDVDLKDNVGIDMTELKKHISRLPYVLLCAYSVRGGLWFVVRLPDNQTPDTLSGHFRYLQKLFTDWFGIKLDGSKGGNPTDLRFVSYDPEPYINENPSVMAGIYNPPPPNMRVFDSCYNTDDSQLLNRIINALRIAGAGERHIKLLKLARVIGGYIGAGRLDEQTAVYALETVASEWPNFTKSQKTIRDGIRNGKLAPIGGSDSKLQNYRQSHRPKASPPKLSRSKLENLPIEYVSVSFEAIADYPKGWDVTDQKPTFRLVVSPRRAEIAAAFNLPKETLPLFSFEPISSQLEQNFLLK
ncbi:BT4734/BF3469 family protein [Larkinella terrae]|uniref:Virulence-protein E N-terminal domain-containing protein n=1 Tax=Larkinella terrae TaxID=2025311 RepID=A0A7K0EHI4_9BACT|nr:BT4734/BF3469 family protein [Larkinella terrae]MRS61215.1 hypothetical protein [Larkinella terrae]